MKCENCNEREASFFYTATVNGETTQNQLCLDCARELGLTAVFERPVFENFNFFGNPFSTLMRMAVAERTAMPQAQVLRIPNNIGAELKGRRDLISLKHQLKTAVRDEDYERAIELRDKIKSMETV